MDKALVFGTKDCRLESCQGHFALRITTHSQLSRRALLRCLLAGSRTACRLPRPSPSRLLPPSPFPPPNCEVAALPRGDPEQLLCNLGKGRGRGERCLGHRMLQASFALLWAGAWLQSWRLFGSWSWLLARERVQRAGRSEARGSGGLVALGSMESVVAFSM